MSNDEVASSISDFNLSFDYPTTLEWLPPSLTSSNIATYDGISSTVLTTTIIPVENSLTKFNSTEQAAIKKLGRNRQNILTRDENKKARNSNQVYYDYKGRLVEGRKFDETFTCTCSMKCSTKLPLEDRRRWFDTYWRLGNYEAQTALIAALVKEFKKKKQNKSRRAFSRTYQLSNVVVCREMFIKTLGITSKRVNTSLMKIRLNSLEDKRGQGQGGRNKKVYKSSAEGDSYDVSTANASI